MTASVVGQPAITLEATPVLNIFDIEHADGSRAAAVSGVATTRPIFMPSDRIIARWFSSELAVQSDSFEDLHAQK